MTGKGKKDKNQALGHSPHPFSAIEGSSGHEQVERTVRYDWLNQYLFESIDEMRDFATDWLWMYNNERPNMGIGESLLP